MSGSIDYATVVSGHERQSRNLRSHDLMASSSYRLTRILQLAGIQYTLHSETGVQPGCAKIA